MPICSLLNIPMWEKGKEGRKDGGGRKEEGGRRKTRKEGRKEGGGKGLIRFALRSAVMPRGWLTSRACQYATAPYGMLYDAKHSACSDATGSAHSTFPLPQSFPYYTMARIIRALYALTYGALRMPYSVIACTLLTCLRP